MMNLILLGPPGSGKGTLGRMVVEASTTDRAFGGQWVEFDTGTRLREFAYGGDTELQNQVRQLLESGQVAPTPLVLEFYRAWMKENAKPNQHILSSGFPRGDQANPFLEEVRAGAYPCDGLLWLEAPEDILFDRLGGRRTCTNGECNEIFHIAFRPPLNAELCDACGFALHARPEDLDIARMRRRIAIQKDVMLPVRERLKQEGIPIFDIDASQRPERVFSQVRDIMSTLTAHLHRSGPRL